jgi:hypothetical protein
MEIKVPLYERRWLKDVSEEYVKAKGPGYWEKTFNPHRDIFDDAWKGEMGDWAVHEAFSIEYVPKVYATGDGGVDIWLAKDLPGQIKTTKHFHGKLFLEEWQPLEKLLDNLIFIGVWQKDEFIYQLRGWMTKSEFIEKAQPCRCGQAKGIGIPMADLHGVDYLLNACGRR